METELRAAILNGSDTQTHRARYRAARAFEIRRSAAALYEQLIVRQNSNGDALGEVSSEAYAALLRAISSESPTALDEIPMGDRQN